MQRRFKFMIEVRFEIIFNHMINYLELTDVTVSFVEICTWTNLTNYLSLSLT